MCISVVRSKPGDVGYAVFLRLCVATEQPVTQQISEPIRNLSALSRPRLNIASPNVPQNVSFGYFLCAPVAQIHILMSQTSNMLI